jgi:hypothetical protein
MGAGFSLSLRKEYKRNFNRMKDKFWVLKIGVELTICLKMIFGVRKLASALLSQFSSIQFCEFLCFGYIKNKGGASAPPLYLHDKQTG